MICAGRWPSEKYKLAGIGTLNTRSRAVATPVV